MTNGGSCNPPCCESPSGRGKPRPVPAFLRAVSNTRPASAMGNLRLGRAPASHTPIRIFAVVGAFGERRHQAMIARKVAYRGGRRSVGGQRGGLAGGGAEIPPSAAS